MYEYSCRACGEEFELALASTGTMRCPECLQWEAVMSIHTATFMEEMRKHGHAVS